VVDGVTVAAFSALPLLAGLVAVALLSRFGGWVIRTALIVGPLLAIVTIVAMTLPTDLDTTSKATLALCHLALVPIIIVAVRLLSRRAEVPAQVDVVTGPA
jgi:peptidoglycan/LPS O-acetylase OafA/YrhL